MMSRRVANGLAFVQRVPKVLALTGVWIAVLAAGAVDLRSAEPDGVC